jgi:hypothetical protein
MFVIGDKHTRQAEKYNCPASIKAGNTAMKYDPIQER